MPDSRHYERWYRSQFSYHKTLGEPPGQAYPASMSAREMCDLLGIPLNNTGYALIRRHLFDSFNIRLEFLGKNSCETKLPLEIFETFLQCGNFTAILKCCSDSQGRRFESCRAYQTYRMKLLFCKKTQQPCGFQGCFGSHRSSLEILLFSC